MLPMLLSLAAAAFVQNGGAHYRAEVATPPTAQRLIVRSQLWTCAAGTCSASASGSRPAVVCASLARQVGELRSFTAAGRAFEAEELAACNARAR